MELCFNVRTFFSALFTHSEVFFPPLEGLALRPLIIFKQKTMDEYNDVTTKREEKTMKKVLLAIGGGIGVIVGAILIWKFVLPFIGFVFQPIWRFLSALLNRHEHKRQRPGS